VEPKEVLLSPRALVPIALLLLVAAATGLVIANSLDYFTLSDDLPFLVEKGEIALRPLWRTFFLAHVAGGIGCLLAGPLLLWNRLTLRSRRAHVWIGRAYVLFVLGWGGPAGIALAFGAKGGVAGKSGFLLLGLLWWTATLIGLRAVLAQRLARHVAWMARSYAIATSALTFRLFHIGLYSLGIPDGPNYVLSIWLSLVASLVAGEALATRAPALLAREGPRLGKGALA